MPTISQVGNSSNSHTSSSIELDEFIPIVRYQSLGDLTLYSTEEAKYTKSDEDVKLSDYLDSNKSSYKAILLTTTKNKVEIPFSVAIGKGSEGWFQDNDGYIEAELKNSDGKVAKGVSIEGIRRSIKLNDKKKLIKTNDEFKKESSVFIKFKESLEIKLKFTSKESISFYIDFKANDNDDIYNNGDYENVHCGRMKVEYVYTVCTDWDTVAPVIAKDKFVGWDHKNHPKWVCYDYAVKQLKDAGYSLKSSSWRDWSKKKMTMNSNIYQLFLEADVAGMKKGVQKEQFNKGVKYLKETLKKQIPIMVGVDDDYINPNDDKTTEHFIVIVGMGSDTDGNYFLFYDNAIGNKSIGASSKNKLYCDCENFMISGKGDLRNQYLQKTSKKKYIVTHIRETK